MKTDVANCDWEEIQDRFADVPGEDGVALRSEFYAPFFLRFGEQVRIDQNCRFYHPDRIVLEDDVRINREALVYGSGGVWIGRHARIGPRCFIHSANHDISDGPDAFFERGYREAAVQISDNALISGNVTLLPGATLGAGCFVAAGAVVTNKEFDDQVHLLGVPARARPQQKNAPLSPAPEIALLVPRTGHWKAGAKHVLTPLGLPQITVVEEGASLPDTVHTLVLIGPPDWRPPVEDKTIWQLEDGRTATTMVQPGVSRSGQVGPDWPKCHTVLTVRDGMDGRSRKDADLDQLVFWLRQRLNKGAGSLSQRDYREWQTTLEVLLAEGLADSDWVEELRSEVDRRKPDVSKDSEHRSEAAALDLSSILKEPEYLVYAANRWREERKQEGSRSLANRSGDDEEQHPQDNERDKLVELLRNAIPHCKNAHRLVAMSLAANLLYDRGSLKKLNRSLSRREWRHKGTAFPRLTADGRGFCYSPLVLIWKCMDAGSSKSRSTLTRTTGAPLPDTVPLEWHHASSGKLFSPRKKTISRSLFNNWLTLHSASIPAGRQILLDRQAYTSIISSLEDTWFEIFRAMQAAAKRPLVRLRPWPADYRAAFSLRYDVDRPVNAKQISHIVRLQRTVIGAPCATWYYFPDDTNRLKQCRQLRRHAQELGIHVERAKDALSGHGVTHHSAPTSEYWRGEQTSRRLEGLDVDHCEFLAAQLSTPRPTWLTSASNKGRIARIWSTPIHFPAEGSTGDADLGYFDRLLNEFREVLERGGHTIVASHPDLSQEYMAQLFDREDLEDVWFASVGRVVARARQVLEFGSVRTVNKMNPEHVALYSQSHISDLSLEVWLPGADAPIKLTTQLLAGQPREISAQKDEQ